MREIEERTAAPDIAAPDLLSARPKVREFELIDLASKGAAPSVAEARPPRRTKTTLAEMLRSSRWAGALTSEELDRVCRECHERFVAAGVVFVRAGTAADFWVGVIEGMAKMSVSLPNGRESTFTAVSAGGWFGEGTLMKSERWRYDAIAVRDSRFACIPRATFERLLNTSLPFSHSVLTLMNARLSQFIGLAVFDRLLSADTRVARCLASLFNSDLYPSASPSVKLTQDEIGLLSAVSRQRANRALHALQDAGLVRIEFGGVTVLDVPGLWRFSGDSEVRNTPKHRGPRGPGSRVTPAEAGVQVGPTQLGPGLRRDDGAQVPTASSKLPP